MSSKKPHPLALLVGNRIKQFREAKGWLQQDLADRLGVSQKWISDLERGATTPQVDTIAKVAHALSVEPYELFLTASRSSGTSETDKRKILSTLKRCNPKSRESIWRVLETLTEYEARQK